MSGKSDQDELAKAVCDAENDIMETNQAIEELKQNNKSMGQDNEDLRNSAMDAMAIAHVAFLIKSLFNFYFRQWES
jgi:hypothetical protein